MSRRVASTKGEPLLSFVMTGRDDDYMPDFKYRLTTTLEFLCQGAAALGRLDDIEVLVVDWASPCPLVQTLRLSRHVCAVSRFVQVPKAVADTVQQGRWPFHNTVSVNAGIRRARGRHVAVTAADQLLPETALAATLSVLDGQLRDVLDPAEAFLMIPRRHVPWSFVNRQPTVDEWRRYVLFGAPNASFDSHLSSVCSGMGALIMTRQRWAAMKGLDETMGGWGYSDLEIGVRVTREVPGVDLASVGAYYLHMEHPPNGDRHVILNDQSKRNVEQYRATSAVNDEDWGLADAALDLQCPVAAATMGGTYLPEPRRKARIDDPSGGSDAESCAFPKEDFIRNLKTRLLASGASSVNVEDLDALAFLASHARMRRPRTFVDIGACEGETSFAVVDASPAVEVYVLDTWEGDTFRRSPRTIADDLKHRTMHRGYVRFLNGDPVESLRTLSNTTNGSSAIDLAFIRASRVRGRLTQVVMAVMSGLAPEGGVVVQGTPASDEWNDCVKALESAHRVVVSSCMRHATSYVRRPSVALDAKTVPMITCPTSDVDELRELWNTSPPLRDGFRRRTRDFGRRVARRLARF